MKDLGKAFSAYFKDPKWFTKFLIGILWMVACILVVGIFVLAGYFVQITQRVMRREEPVLPDWSDIGGKIVTGFKFSVVYLVYLIPIFLLILPAIVLGIVAGATGDEGDAMPVLLSIYIFGVTLLMIPYSLAISLFAPIIAYRFAERERISDALDLGAVLRDFQGNWQNVLVIALIMMGIQSIASIGLFILLIGIFFTIFYAYAVSAYLSGVLYLSRGPKEGIV
jgi:hypothetical protein